MLSPSEATKIGLALLVLFESHTQTSGQGFFCPNFLDILLLDSPPLPRFFVPIAWRAGEESQ